MEFEDILQETGGYGNFQKKFLILFLFPLFSILPCFWFNKIFMLSVPQHWCSVPDLLLSNLSIDVQRALISPPSDPSCSMYNVSYAEMLAKGNFKVPNDSEIMPCVAGWQYDTENYEQTAASKWNMVCDYKYLPSLMYTLSGVGSLIGSPIYGFLSDKFGRRIIFLFLTGLAVVTEIAFALSNDIYTFAIVGIIHGSVVPSIFTIPFVLTLELAIPCMRAHINVVTNIFWTFGLCFIPLVAYLSRNYTTLCYVTAVFASLILCCFRFIPESPRWLISQGKIENAMNIVMKIAKENGKSPNEAMLLSQLETLKEKEKKERKGYTNPHVILTYPRLRRNLLILAFCWTTFNVSYSVLTYNIINLNGNEFINFFLMSIVEFPGSVVLWYSMSNFGRRWTVTLGYFIAGICCLLPITGLNNSAIASSMIGKFLVNGLIMISNQQGVELFPTGARSFGLGAGKTISSAIGLICPFIAYLGLYGKYLPFLIISLTCLTTSFLSSFLPETMNENLPQTILDAELFGKEQKYFSWNRSKPTAKSSQGSNQVNAQSTCETPEQ